MSFKELVLKSNNMPHKVVDVPDTLSIIFGFLADDSQSLAACLRVSKTWFAEAARILWAHCGWHDRHANSSFCHPYTKHLQALFQNSQRLQVYANQIEFLSFGFGPRMFAESYWREGRMHSIFDDWKDGWSHLLLVDTRFPRLKTLTLNENIRLEPRLFGQYLQPNLESLEIRSGFLMPNLLFFIQVCPQDSLIALTYLIQENCPRITTLSLRGRYGNIQDPADPTPKPNMAELAFIRLLKRLPSLTSFHGSSDFLGSWVTGAALKALTECPALIRIHLSLADPEFPMSLAEISTASFPKLKYASFRAQENRLWYLCRSGLKIEELGLQVVGQSSSIFRLCALLKNIRKLDIRFMHGDNTIIEGVDLLVLANNCHHLEEFACSLFGDEYIRAEGLTDQVIDQFAREMPQLRVLEIKHLSDGVTEKSLLSLGTHCLS